MTITKIIHMTWKSKDLPRHYQENVNKWQTLHPDYKIIIYDDQDLRNYINEHYPEFLNLYDGFPKHIMRVDFVRYAILHREGGIYADMDTFPVKNFDDFMNSSKILLASEATEHCQKQHKSQLLCNAIMISPSKISFWYKFMQYIQNSNLTDVLGRTGPLALTNFIEEYPEEAEQVNILPSCYFYPMLDATKYKGQNVVCNGQKLHNISKLCDPEQIYAVHTWNHTWCTSNNDYLWWVTILIIVIIIVIILIYILK